MAPLNMRCLTTVNVTINNNVLHPFIVFSCFAWVFRWGGQLAFSKVKHSLGLDQAKHCFSGAAPIAKEASGTNSGIVYTYTITSMPLTVQVQYTEV